MTLAIPTAPKLPNASQRKSSGFDKIAAKIHWPSSKKDTKDISVPANVARVFGGTRVCVISWLVRSKTQSPRRDAERKKNTEMVATGCPVNDDARATDLAAEPLGIKSVSELPICHTAKTTGICGR